MNLKHFRAEEFYCRCGGCPKVLPKMEIIYVAQAIREALGKPVFIRSGIRCDTYNRAIGGSDRSRHCPRNGGDAIDIGCHDAFDRLVMVRRALSAGAKCIEVCDRHLHLDLRPGPEMILWGKSH